MNVLLHVCCGICAAGAAERLMAEGHSVTGYFYNPNIYPQEEYQLRLAAAKKVADELGFELIEGPYDAKEWDDAVRMYRDEPEGGKRCVECFRVRLQKTFLSLPASGCDVFTSTLTISPHKSAAVVNAVGSEIGRENWLVRDFKKKDGFNRANLLSKQWGLYRQNYCGCIYSKIAD